MLKKAAVFHLLIQVFVHDKKGTFLGFFSWVSRRRFLGVINVLEIATKPSVETRKKKSHFSEKMPLALYSEWLQQFMKLN